MIVERIAQWIEDNESADFGDLVSEAFSYQYERVGPYRRLCESLGVVPGPGISWSDVPLVPTTAFKTVELAAADGLERFESSGTTDDRPSVHRHPFPNLYRTVIDATFPGTDISEEAPILSLVPSREQAPHSSLAFMVDRIVSTRSTGDSAWAVGPRGVLAPVARGFLAARQRDRRPCWIFSTAFALVELLEALERLGLRFRLPPGSRVLETGGYKGRTRELERDELAGRVETWLGVPGEAMVREYGMTELTSHFYAVPGRAPFRPMPWTRVRALDPVTLLPVSPGDVGLISIFDLANVGSALHLLTEDLGRVEADGFELVGRARSAELRGCSLLSEALST